MSLILLIAEVEKKVFNSLDSYKKLSLRIVSKVIFQELLEEKQIKSICSKAFVLYNAPKACLISSKFLGEEQKVFSCFCTRNRVGYITHIVVSHIHTHTITKC